MSAERTEVAPKISVRERLSDDSGVGRAGAIAAGAGVLLVAVLLAPKVGPFLHATKDYSDAHPLHPTKSAASAPKSPEATGGQVINRGTSDERLIQFARLVAGGSTTVTISYDGIPTDKLPGDKAIDREELLASKARGAAAVRQACEAWAPIAGRDWKASKWIAEEIQAVTDGTDIHGPGGTTTSAGAALGVPGECQRMVDEAAKDPKQLLEFPQR